MHSLEQQARSRSTILIRDRCLVDIGDEFGCCQGKETRSVYPELGTCESYERSD